MASKIVKILIIIFFIINVSIFSINITKFIERTSSTDLFEIPENTKYIDYLIDNSQILYTFDDEGVIEMKYRDQTISLGSSYSKLIFPELEEAVNEDGQLTNRECKFTKIRLTLDSKIGIDFQDRILFWDYCYNK